MILVCLMHNHVVLLVGLRKIRQTVIVKSSLLIHCFVYNKGCNVSGLGAKEAKQLCPPDIEVAYNNGPNFCTLSGPADCMKSFVRTLQQQDVFAKEVNCANIAYHSKYIAPASLTLLKYLREVRISHVVIHQLFKDTFIIIIIIMYYFLPVWVK